MGNRGHSPKKCGNLQYTVANMMINQLILGCTVQYTIFLNRHEPDSQSDFNKWFIHFDNLVQSLSSSVQFIFLVNTSLGMAYTVLPPISER